MPHSSNVPVFVAQISDERGQDTGIMQFDEFFCDIELLKEKLRTLKATDELRRRSERTLRGRCDHKRNQRDCGSECDYSDRA